MSEERPSAAAAMYPHLAAGQDGSLGETGLDTARRVQMDGVAKPSAAQGLYPGGPHRDGPVLGEARQGAPAAAFDPAQYRPADGAELDQTMMGEFSRGARQFGIGQEAGQWLVSDMYPRAVKAAEQRYINELEANAPSWTGSLAAADVEAAKTLLDDPAFTPPALRDWVKSWASRHPDFGRMIAAWGGAAARGARRY